MSVHPILPTIGSIVASIVGITTAWGNIAKFISESRKANLEASEMREKTLEVLGRVSKDIEELKEQNKYQQALIDESWKLSKSHYRMTLFGQIAKALKRGHTTVDEATEITKMYDLYKKNGGNGEVEILFNKFDKLEIKEDSYEVK